MRNYFRFLLFFSPFIYLLVAAFASVLLAYTLFSLVDIPIAFPKSVNRGALLFLVLGIYPFAVLIGLNRRDFGFSGFDKGFYYRILLGWAIGTFILIAVVVVLLVLDVRVIDVRASVNGYSIGLVLCKAFAIGLLVSCLEETLFRGLLLGGLLARSAKGFALTTSAFYYALLHFLRSNLHIENHQITLLSGFEVIIDSLSQLFTLEILDSFLALFLSGIFLGMVRIHSKHGLGYCIGLHAGWVFVIKTTKALTNGNPHASSSFLVGGYDGIIGYLAAGWLALLIIVLMRKRSAD